MEISALSTSVTTSGQFSSTSRTDLRPTEHSEKSDEMHRHHGRRGGGYRGRALGIFRQELRETLRAQFNPKLAGKENPYTRTQQPATSGDVADEALVAARQVVAESPTKASAALISFRARVQETATSVRETVGASDDVADVDDAVARIGKGLDDLEGQVASNRESSASVLAIDTRSKQRSTISIRTQEGDIVKLSLRRKQSLSATDVAVSNGNGTSTSTEVEVSSRSRMMLKVEGDLNESERAAIQNVFAQAEQMANDFFGGDMAKAFSLAEGFEFDTEQLARVSMQFRMRQVSNVVSLAPAPATPMPTTPIGPEASPPVAAPESPVAPISTTQPATDTPAPVVPDVLETSDEPVATRPPEVLASDKSSALSDFFDSLSAFLRSVGEGFGVAESGASYTYHYSESFKLSLLNAVMHTVAPDVTGDATGKTGEAIGPVFDEAVD